jgi:hypothetical protein
MKARAASSMVGRTERESARANADALRGPSRMWRHPSSREDQHTRPAQVLGRHRAKAERNPDSILVHLLCWRVPRAVETSRRSWRSMSAIFRRSSSTIQPGRFPHAPILPASHSSSTRDFAATTSSRDALNPLFYLRAIVVSRRRANSFQDFLKSLVLLPFGHH